MNDLLRVKYLLSSFVFPQIKYLIPLLNVLMWITNITNLSFHFWIAGWKQALNGFDAQYHLGRVRENVSSGICGQRRPRSACASAQSDQGLHYLLTESADTTECMQRPGGYFAHAQDDLNLRILRVFDVPVLLDATYFVIFSYIDLVKKDTISGSRTRWRVSNVKFI